MSHTQTPPAELTLPELVSALEAEHQRLRARVAELEQQLATRPQAPRANKKPAPQSKKRSTKKPVTAPQPPPEPIIDAPPKPAPTPRRVLGTTLSQLRPRPR